MSTAHPWQRSQLSGHLAATTSQARLSASVSNTPAYRSPLVSQQAAFRADMQRTKKRKHDEMRQMFVAAAAAPLLSKWTEITPNQFDMTEVHPHMEQLSQDEFWFDFRNTRHQPSYFFGLHRESPDFNMFAPINLATGRYVFKVLATDAASLRAMAQTIGALARQRNSEIAVLTADFRSATMDRDIRPYRDHVNSLADAVILADQGVKCCNCGQSGHTVRLCAVPKSRTGNLGESDWGTISACPKCNTWLHIVDDCQVIKAELAKLSDQGKLQYLGKMICWGRYNKPPIQSEKWFFLDLLEQYRNTGNMTDRHLTEPIADHVSWTESFTREMATVICPSPSSNHSNYTADYFGDVTQPLPKDPFWNNKTVAQALEMHKAGAFDHFRYLSKTTRAQRFPHDGELAARMATILMMFLEHAGLWGPPRTSGIAGDCELLVDDEIPKQTVRVVHVADSPCDELRFSAAQLLNPGVWKPHPTGIIIANEDGSQTVTDFVVFVPTDECEELQKADPVLFQRVKRAVNRYRLKRISADNFDRDDFIECFIASMAATARNLRLQQDEADAEADDGAPNSAELDDEMEYASAEEPA